MDLLPLLKATETGIPWLDHTIRVAFIVYVLYSLFLNILVKVSPDAPNWTWVRVSLALVANVNVIFSKILVKPDPAPATLPTGYAAEAPTRPNGVAAKPELRTRVDNPKPEPPDGAA